MLLAQVNELHFLFSLCPLSQNTAAALECRILTCVASLHCDDLISSSLCDLTARSTSSSLLPCGCDANNYLARSLELFLQSGFFPSSHHCDLEHLVATCVALSSVNVWSYTAAVAAASCEEIVTGSHLLVGTFSSTCQNDQAWTSTPQPPSPQPVNEEVCMKN